MSTWNSIKSVTWHEDMGNANPKCESVWEYATSSDRLRITTKKESYVTGYGTEVPETQVSTSMCAGEAEANLKLLIDFYETFYGKCTVAQILKERNDSKKIKDATK
jgi:hypothetical protein